MKKTTTALLALAILWLSIAQTTDCQQANPDKYNNQDNLYNGFITPPKRQSPGYGGTG